MRAPSATPQSPAEESAGQTALPSEKTRQPEITFPEVPSIKDAIAALLAGKFSINDGVEPPIIESSESAPSTPHIAKNIWTSLTYALRNLFSIEQELQNKFLSTEAMQEIDELLRAAITLVRTSRKSCPTFEALFDHNSDFGLFTLITFRIPKLTSQEEAERIEAKDLIKKYLRSLIATISATKFWAEGEKLESKPVNLHDLIEEITPSLNIEFIVTEESIVQIDVPKDLVISADPYTLQALLENMVKNAAVHGDALRLKIVGSRQSDKIATIEVSDDGPGVNANIAPRIFDWKVTDGKGSGLGLANGIERMAQMGGTMTLEPNGGLENELGSKGAKFIMTFAIA